MTDWLTEAARRPVQKCEHVFDQLTMFCVGCHRAASDIANEPRPGALKELPDGLHYGADGKVMYHCRGCDQFKELEIDPAEFVFGDAKNLCGGSPRCCP